MEGSALFLSLNYLLSSSVNWSWFVWALNFGEILVLSRLNFFRIPGDISPTVAMELSTQLLPFDYLTIYFSMAISRLLSITLFHLALCSTPPSSSKGMSITELWFARFLTVDFLFSLSSLIAFLSMIFPRVDC
jgi:hypothetical protein